MADAHYHVGKHVITLPTADALGNSSNGKSGTAKGKAKTVIAEEEAKARAKIAAQADKKIEKQAAKTTKSKAKKGTETANSSAASSGEERTIVKVTPLSNTEERRDELAQLAGGKSLSEAIAFADSLLAQAETIRKAG